MTDQAMTPADRVQRVSDEELVRILMCAAPHETKQALALDLRDARQSEAAKDARIAELEAQIVTREREAWCAGRDACLNEITELSTAPFGHDDPDVRAAWHGGFDECARDAERAIRALTPPQEGEGHE